MSQTDTVGEAWSGRGLSRLLLAWAVWGPARAEKEENASICAEKEENASMRAEKEENASSQLAPPLPAGDDD